MKRFNTILILIIIITAAFSSCKKDKKNDTVSIIGKWYMKKYIFITVDNRGIKNTTEYPPIAESYIDIRSDGTYERKVDNNKPYIKEYKVIDNKLYTYHQPSQSGTTSPPTYSYIEELTESSLILRTESIRDENGTEETRTIFEK